MTVMLNWEGCGTAYFQVLSYHWHEGTEEIIKNLSGYLASKPTIQGFCILHSSVEISISFPKT
jgi:hypothetical protein